MMQPSLVPTLDPNPLPAPYWVFKLLLIVTFFLHIVAMNSMLGGAVLALAAKWRSKNREHGKRVFFEMAKKLPSLLPATITLGIAPLLFVQVLYGQFFYTSSIIIAWPWFLVLVFLTVAYYGFYYVSFQRGQHSGRAGAVMLFSVVLIFLIGFVYSNNLTLSQTPSRWGETYFANLGGWNLNLSEPTLIPRFLHFMVAAVAVGGLVLVFVALANWKRDHEYARQVLQFGGKAFMYATMAQILVGLVFLVSLPRDLRMLFMGDNPLATALLLVGVTGGLGAIFLMSDALRKENLRVAVFYVPAITCVVILSMSVMREILRDAYLKPYVQAEQFTVSTQWSVFPLFLALFIGGVILWVVMLKQYGLFGGRRATHPSQSIDSMPQDNRE
jgi:TRAP-type mannitol/chloroaromatic compound transport system permease small subunit